jgi:hypothetical protein
MIEIQPFQGLRRDQKVDFFIKAQELLIKYHPDSEFLFRQNNAQERLKIAKDLMAKYKGMCYADSNVIVLYNKVMVNELDPITILRDHMFHEPSNPYNAVTIDFVVFRELTDCMMWVKNQYDPQIKFVVFVKNNQPQMYRTEKLISKIFNMPIASGPVMV